MTNTEIISLIITIIVLVAICIGFTFLFRWYYLSNIKEVNKGESDIDLLKYKKKQIEKKSKKIYKICRVFSKILEYLVFVVVIGFFGFSVVSRVTNNTLIFGDTGFLVIASDSMSYKNESNEYLYTYELDNQFSTYDIIGISKYDSVEDVNLYDVVAFYGQDGAIYVHRIISIYGDNTYITRGDANNSSDNGSLYASRLSFYDIIGYYNGVNVPKFGAVIIFIQSNIGIATIVAIVYSLLVFDHYKSKYEKSIVDRTTYIEGVINYDYSLEDLVTMTKNEDGSYVLNYQDKEYKFVDGNFVENPALNENESQGEDTKSA